MECLTTARHYINPKTEFTFKRGFDYRSYPQSKPPDGLLDSYFPTFYISVCHPEFQISTDSPEELPPWARGSVPLLQWDWRPHNLDFSCQHNLDPKMIVAIDIPQTPPHYLTGIDEFKEVDVYLSCLCADTRNTLSPDLHKYSNGTTLLENGEVILAMSRNTSYENIIIAAIINRKTEKISLISSWKGQLGNYKDEFTPSYNPDYYIKKSPLSAPRFFWLRLKSILQDTYGKE